MYQQQKSFLAVILGATLFIGCGSDSKKSEDSHDKLTEKTIRTSTYINKGNFVDVAKFAYKKATDSSFTQYAMEVKLPGSEKEEIITLSPYEITVSKVGMKFKKIVVKNYENSVELKFVDEDSVNVLFKDKAFMIDQKMSLADFIALG